MSRRSREGTVAWRYFKRDVLPFSAMIAVGSSTLFKAATLRGLRFYGVSVSLVGAVHTWGLHLKGPVYISMFKPLSIAIAVAMGAIFLGNALHLGSVIGSVILCFGFYTVIWGKARENATKTGAGSEHSPLLLTHTVEDEALSLR